MKMYLCLLCLLIALLPATSLAHNGSVALAYPVEGIVLDGDLSDWPANFVSYPVQTRYLGDLPQDAEDFQGSFRVGYSESENALYFAVEVRDESTVIDDEEPVDPYFPNNRDGCALLANLAPEDQQTFSYAPRVLGDRRHFFSADIEVVVGRDPQAHYYEWRVVAGPETGDPVQLRPGMVLDAMITLWDFDADGSFTQMAWGAGDFRSGGLNLNDVVLVAGDTGRLQGTVQWADGSEAAGTKVRLRSQRAEDHWLQVSADRQGRFTAELPPGSYVVEALGQRSEVDVRPGALEHVELAGLPPRGRELAVERRITAAGVGTRRGSWQVFGVADGLHSRYIYAMEHDRQGHLWFGDYGGIIRYDGREFVYLSAEEGPLSEIVYAIEEDRQGHLWFGGYGGVTRYDGREFVHFTSQDGLLDDGVRAIHEDGNGHLWVGTGSGVSRYDGQKFVHFTSQDGLFEGAVEAIEEDGEGRLYFAGYGGLSRYDGVGFHNFRPEDGLIHYRLSDLLFDRNGHLWISSFDGGISRFDGKEFVNFKEINGVEITDEVYTIAEDHQGHLWFGTWGQGVFRYDGTKWETYDTQDGLPSEQIMMIFRDREEGLWFAAGGGGLSLRDDYHFRTFTTTDGLVHNLVKTVVEDQEGHLWLGTTHGLSRYDGKNFVNLKMDDRRDYFWWSTRDRQGHLWFSTSGGVRRFDGEKWTTYAAEEGLGLASTVGIMEDHQGHLWASGSGGVSRFDGEKWTTFTTADGLASNFTGNSNITSQRQRRCRTVVLTIGIR